MGSAFKVFDEMGERGVSVNVVTYDKLIGGFCRKKKMTDAEKLLRRMRSEGLRPSVVTFNLVINGYLMQMRKRRRRTIAG